VSSKNDCSRLEKANSFFGRKPKNLLPKKLLGDCATVSYYLLNMKKIAKIIIIFLIRLYQLLISPIIGGNRCCRFLPTCSNYAIEAIEKLGIIKGGLVALARIARCNPWGDKGYDPVCHKNNQPR